MRLRGSVRRGPQERGGGLRGGLPQQDAHDRMVRPRFVYVDYDHQGCVQKIHCCIRLLLLLRQLLLNIDKVNVIDVMLIVRLFFEIMANCG